MALNLSVLNVSEVSESGIDIELVHPATGEGLDAWVRVRGKDSRTVQNHARKVVNDMQKREKIAKGKNKDADMSIEELEMLAVERAVIRIISWRGIEEDGQPVPFTVENATRVLKDNPWIREQVLENSDDLTGFFR
jgi:predicted TIM-barrel fold metal-dependent hydrolase